MAQLALQRPGVTGTKITYTAASSGGDAVSVGSDVYLLVSNKSVSAVTVTLVTPGNAFNGSPIPDTVVSVPASSDMLIPVKNAAYKNSAGNAAITYSAVTSVTVAALAV